MPANPSRPESDKTTARAAPAGQDGSGLGGTASALSAGETSSSSTFNQLSSTRGTSTSAALPSDEASNASVIPSMTASKDGSHSSHGTLLQISSDGGASKRPVETSIWDWDTPLEPVDDSTSYYYEPVGELLQEHRDQRQGRDEFTIPHTISGPSAHWPFPPSAVTSNITDTLAVPSSKPASAPATVAGSKRKSPQDREGRGVGKQQDAKRSSRVMAESGGEPSASPHNTRSQGGASTRRRSVADASETQAQPSSSDAHAARAQTGGRGQRRTLADPSIPMILPPRKVFPIQIGDKLFRLSGASISSDAPSYFSQFFEDQLRQNEGADNVRTLYVDRDPATFEDISLHLQGYHVEPRDGPHFVKLFADAQFFSLPRLTAQLFASTIYIRIGDEEFQIPRDLFSSPGDSPNYFSLGFSIFFASPNEAFPGLNQRSLLRPPSILPPSVPNRSAKTFADLLHILKGYPVEIRSEEHRAELLRDARYFHLKGLEQRLIPHEISYNLARKTSEILIRLGDIRQSGVSFVSDSAAQASETESPSSASSSTPSGPGWVFYQRPYVDSEAYSLIVEIAGEEATFLSLAPKSPNSSGRVGRATFHRQTLSRITSLFSVIANKMNLPVTQPLGLMMMERGAGVASLPVSPRNTGVSEEKVKVRIGADADVTVDGKKWIVDEEEDEGNDEETSMDVDPSSSSIMVPSKRRKRDTNDDEDDEGEEWVIKKSQWRLRVQPLAGGSQQGSGRSGMEVILGAVKIEAYSNERARNVARGFLM